jgi:hypothetical protein
VGVKAYMFNSLQYQTKRCIKICRGPKTGIYFYLTAAPQILFSYDYFLVKLSHAAFAIFWGEFQYTP